MTRITVVIEDHAEGIHLGQQLAGGRVVAAMQGEVFPRDDPETPEPAEDLNELRRDAERYRAWRDGACYRPGEVAKALALCSSPVELDEAVDKLI